MSDGCDLKKFYIKDMTEQSTDYILEIEAETGSLAILKFMLYRDMNRELYQVSETFDHKACLCSMFGSYYVATDDKNFIPRYW